MDITYRLSCDDCPGIVIQPQENIKVSATGSSNDVVVKSVGAMPGMYYLHLFAKSSDGRGTEQNIGTIKANVRPYDKCLDLDRYELDLYRDVVSESTGEALPATSYDTINLINRCYGQDIKIEVKMKDSDRLWASIISGVKNGLMSGGARFLLFDLPGMLKGGDKKEDPLINNGLSINTSATTNTTGDGIDQIIGALTDSLKNMNTLLDNISIIENQNSDNNNNTNDEGNNNGTSNGDNNEIDKNSIVSDAQKGDLCDPNKKIVNTEEYLFDIRDVQGDKYVYVCSGNNTFRSCVDDKWTDKINIDKVKYKDHPVVTQCKSN
jgi:hypothetical protein